MNTRAELHEAFRELNSGSFVKTVWYKILQDISRAIGAAGPAKKNRQAEGRFTAAAMNLYWAEGLGVSLNEICRQAGIAKTSFYREFGSEDELMARAIRCYSDTFVTHSSLPAPMTSQAQPVSMPSSAISLTGTIRRRRVAACWRKCAHAPEGIGPQAKVRFEHCKTAQLAALEGFVTRARHRGEIAPDSDVSLTAAYIDNQISNALTLKARGEAFDRIYHFPALKVPLFITNQRS